jgi:hypothetical protein
MAEYPTLSPADLSEFSGRPVASYGKYATQALLQATLLFKIGTCLARLPDSELQKDMARLAILAMADSIFLAQNYQKAAASPFSSETIGSYSYSKVAKAANAGMPTGVMWFDIAMQQMSVCGGGSITGGGIVVFDQPDVPTPDGYTDFLGPDEIDNLRAYGADPAVVISRN